MMPEAEYQAQLAALSAAELQKARSDWFDSPFSTELFVRMRFTSVPNSGSFDELKRFLPSFLQLLLFFTLALALAKLSLMQ